ncbi:MAG: FAD-dependent oxidoreductase [Ktedonobacteraceae bacterium]|nr:FAD-dependent oxidoreductase [Ktedonobacteraceae bacterium]
MPAREILVKRALAIEPFLNPQVLAAVQVPDGVFESFRFCLAFLATACLNGAVVRTYCEVVDLSCSGKNVTGVKIRDHRTGKSETIAADLVINAAGPWAGRIYDTFNVQVADTAHVLDAIDIAWTQDHSLTFRRACHHSSCGTCAMRINGVEKLACITRVVDVWDAHRPIRLDPLRNFPVVSDLVVDVQGFFQCMSASELVITRDAEPYLPLAVDDFDDGVPARTVELPDNLDRFIPCCFQRSNMV